MGLGGWGYCCVAVCWWRMGSVAVMDGTYSMTEYEWAAAKQQQARAREGILTRIREGTPDEEFTVIITSPVTGIGLDSTKDTAEEMRSDAEYAIVLLTPPSRQIAYKYPEGW